MKKIIILPVFLFVSSICLQAQIESTKNKEATEWLQLTDTTYKFTISYPAQWTLKLPNTNTRFFFTSPVTSESDKFRENVNGITRKIEEKGFTILMATDNIKESLAKKLQNFKLINATESKWFGADMLELEYSGTNETDGIKYNVHFLQRMAVINGTLITLTYTAEDLQYENYLTIVRKIFDSFQFK